MKDDTVRRQAAIDLWDKYHPYIATKAMAYDRELRELPSAQPEIIRCKDCKHFHYDMPYIIQGIPVLGHEVCDFWSDGCKTSKNGFCSYAERREE